VSSIIGSVKSTAFSEFSASSPANISSFWASVSGTIVTCSTITAISSSIDISSSSLLFSSVSSAGVGSSVSSSTSSSA